MSMYVHSLNKFTWPDFFLVRKHRGVSKERHAHTFLSMRFNMVGNVAFQRMGMYFKFNVYTASHLADVYT